MDILKTIIERRRNLRTRSKIPFNNFIDKWFNIHDLLEAINKKIYSKNLKQESRGQFIVSTVTTLEVFLKDIVIKLINKYGFDYRPLAKKKGKNFDLMEIEYIIKKNITIGEVIAESCNFQNLDKIQETFSLLFGFNFFEELKKYKWWFDKKNKKEGFFQVDPEFYANWNKLIIMRHNLVHDINFKKNLHMREINNLAWGVVGDVHVIASFIDDILNKKIKIPIKPK